MYICCVHSVLCTIEPGGRHPQDNWDLDCPSTPEGISRVYDDHLLSAHGGAPLVLYFRLSPATHDRTGRSAFHLKRRWQASAILFERDFIMLYCRTRIVV